MIKRKRQTEATSVPCFTDPGLGGEVLLVRRGELVKREEVEVVGVVAVVAFEVVVFVGTIGVVVVVVEVVLLKGIVLQSSIVQLKQFIVMDPNHDKFLPSYECNVVVSSHAVCGSGAGVECVCLVLATVPDNLGGTSGEGGRGLPVHIGSPGGVLQIELDHPATVISNLPSPVSSWQHHYTTTCSMHGFFVVPKVPDSQPSS